MDEEELFVINNILNNLEDMEGDAEMPQRRMRTHEDPFLLSEAAFRKYFRVSKDLARHIIDVLTPFVVAPTRNSALSIERKTLIALRFFGYGSYQEITGTNLFTAVSQSAVSNCIDEICTALGHPDVYNEWVKFPHNAEQLTRLRHRFFQKYGFPGIIGIVDCTHVAIVKPNVNHPVHPEHIYVNRKSYHSINVQLICDESLRILNVNARFPGSAHDAHIWRQSAVSVSMEQLYRNNPRNPFFLLGDAGYPLRPWLLTPLRQVEPGTPEARFNAALTSIRSTIERCNGVLKNRFRCLLRHRVLHYSPTKASQIIIACVVLHNMCIAFNVPEPEDEDDDEEAPDLGMYADLVYEENRDIHDGAFGRVNRDLAMARRLQRQIIHAHYRLP